MAEWLVEEGIGETRAALVADGAITEARIEREGAVLRHGAVADARVGPPASGGRTRVSLAGLEAILRGAAGAPEGAVVRVVVVREAVPERGNPKLPEVRLARTDELPCPAPSLRDRLRAGKLPVRDLTAHGSDDLEAAGWGEVIEAARTGLVPFADGLLRISPTPAMTLIDVDGDRHASELALVGAAAAARAIRLLDIGGSIGIDVPTVADKGARQRAAAAIDAILPLPFERTAINGFGFIQIVRPRLRASLVEMIQFDPVTAAALALLRIAERARIAGGIGLVAAPAIIARIEREPDWSVMLARRIGGRVGLRAEDRLAISAGYVDAFPQH